MQRYRTFGDFILLRRIATGGMADVHLALKRGPATFDRLVALKTILAHHSDHETIVSMFYNEARLGARFNHPNLINVFDVQLIDETLAMVMEYVPGATVSDVVKRAKERGSEFRRAAGIRIVLDACLGLYHAHHLRDLDGTPLTVVHRDVSPQNILVGYNGQVKVFDFGVAHTSGGNGESEQLAGVLAGKYAYMSPEQCQGADLDERSDVFSLGVLLWELTTQRRLFRRKNQVEVLRAVTEEPIPAPSSVADNYPKMLEAVVMSALDRDPGARPPTALALHDDLLRYAALADEQMSSTSLGRFMEDVFSDEIHSEWASLALALEQVEEPDMTGPRRRLPKAARDDDTEQDLEPAEGDGSAEEVDGDMALEALAARTVGGEDAAVQGASGLHSALEVSLTQALRRSRRLTAILAVALFLALAGASTAALLLATGRTAESTAPVLPPDQGQIAIDSDPVGATIFVDGVERAAPTPAVVEAPLGAPVRVRLSLDGYHDAELAVTATTEAPFQNLSLALVPTVQETQHGAVRVVAVPTDARVVIDGELRGRGTPLVVSDLALQTSHTLHVARDGYEPREVPFELTSVATREIRVELQQAVDLGTLTVTSQPPGAGVLVDGESVGVTPLEGMPLVAGRDFEVTLALDGYRPSRTTVNLAPNEVRTLDEHLDRERHRQPQEQGETEASEQTPIEPVEETPEPEPYELLP